MEQIWKSFRNKNNKLIMKKNVILMGVIVFASLVLASCGSNKEQKISSDPPISITAQQLFADYQSNTISSDNKYLNHRLIVKGTVEKVVENNEGDIYVSLLSDAENSFSMVYCFVKNIGKINFFFLIK